MAGQVTLVPDSGSGDAKVVVTASTANKARETSVSTVITGATTGGAEATMTIVQRPAKKFAEFDGLYVTRDEKVEVIPAAGGTFRLRGFSNCNGLRLSHTTYASDGNTYADLYLSTTQLTIEFGGSTIVEYVGVPFASDYGAEGGYVFSISVTIPSIGSGQARTEAKHIFMVSDLNNECVGSLELMQQTTITTQ